ncbi:hypothetical protein Mapa_001986 [Marchantia paleacea]|nr:hypothetical protein Mapa_001986 [Marchantia paleacea]
MPTSNLNSHQMVRRFVKDNKNMAGGFLRLHFHDCFVGYGCDAPVLLNSAATRTEKDAVPNAGSLRGFDEIEQIKAALEVECPGIVSCADVLALAHRDATVKVGGQTCSVALGRKDGKAFCESEADNLPFPFLSLDQLVSNFAAVGLNREEMVDLSGGHNIGRSSCGAVLPRLYNLNGFSGLTDPSIDTTLAKQLKKKLPRERNWEHTSHGFHKKHFRSSVLQGSPEQQMSVSIRCKCFDGAIGKELVTRYSKAGSSFSSDFPTAMTKMSNIRWAADGEVRRVCSSVN